MLPPSNTDVLPTITDNLFGQGAIEQDLVGLSFEPTTSDSSISGELTFGGIDPTKFIGDITY
jgi:cathepsin E